MKDTWRDDRLSPEHDFYTRIGHHDGVAGVYSFCDAHFDAIADNTATIRHNITAIGPPRQVNGRVIKEGRGSPSPGDWRYFTKFTKPDTFSNYHNSRPQSRTHSRLVMKTFGRPIMFAKSLLELVGAMRDALVGMYSLAILVSSAYRHINGFW